MKMKNVVYKPDPVCYSVGDIVINPHGQICKLESMTYYPKSLIEGKPDIDVRVKEKKNVWCTYDIHSLRGVLEAQDIKVRDTLLKKLGEVYNEEG